MAGKQQHVLRIGLAGSEGNEFVLINAAISDSRSLNIKLIGTEGENPYVGSIKQRHLNSLKASSSACSDKEWEAALRRTFLGESPAYDDTGILQGLEVLASLGDGDSMTLNFRKNIDGITQRWGSVKLTLKEDEEIALFEWSAIAAQSADHAHEELNALNARLRQETDNVRKLNEQLEDLILAKQEHENALLEKFRDLLNTKKLKIRDQQRLLAGAKVELSEAVEVQSARNGTPKRQPGASRTSKRKAAAAKVEAESESDSDAFERGGSRQGSTTQEQAQEEAQDDEQGAQVTPDSSDADETEDEDEPEHSISRGKPVAASRAADSTNNGKAKGKSGAAEATEPDSPPPRRELPFAKRESRSQAKASAASGETQAKEARANAAADETEEDEEDDEL